MKKNDYSIPEKLLIAAIQAREKNKTFTAEDLVVEAWSLYPDTFGLAGYSDRYPDSNRVLTNIMGTKGMRGKGWLRKVGEKQYRLTSKGLNEAAIILSGGEEEKTSGEKSLRAELNRRTSLALEKIVSSSAARKVLGETSGDITFNDACSFWDISSRSNANTLNTRLNEVTVLLELATDIANDLDGNKEFKLSRYVVTSEEISSLMLLHEDMQTLFEQELNVIRRRTDERVGKKRINF